jgi:hypothetical protein
MNYTRIYNNLIIKAQNEIKDGHTEQHHIVPKCLGGYNSDVVRLTIKEHYFAHLLLLKIYGKEHPDLIFAILAFHEHSRYKSIPMKYLPKWCRKKLNKRQEELRRNERLKRKT